MKLCYIAPVVAKASITDKITDKMQLAMQQAIQQTIVDPFHTWCHDTWVQFVDTSFILCLSVALAGAICGILGINKGYKVAIVSIIFYVLIRLISWANGWY